MNPLKTTFAILLAFLAVPLLAQDPAEPFLKLKGFSHPESIILDEARNVFYISNMADDQPGDGFISRLDRDGQILDLKWITGLKDPKGLLLNEDKLYVTNNTELVEIDIQKGEIVKQKMVEGAQSLNDITADDAGNLYISDSSKSSIFMRDTSGNIREWLHSPRLEQPNGLLVFGDDILVAAWGKDEPGYVLKVDRKTKKIERISRQGIGNLDGVQKIDSDNFYISDWATGKIHKFNMNGKQEEILISEKSAGDILFLNDSNQLLLPMNFQNEIWWYSLD